MLTSLLGIRLVLWLGKVVPRPAPLSVSEALQSVEVTSDAELGDGFQLTFNLGQTKLGDYDLLQGGSLEPWNRVVIGVLLGVSYSPLIDGIITHHELDPGSGGPAQLTVTGTQLGVLLDQEQRTQKYPNQSDAVIVTGILRRYMPYGIFPAVTLTNSGQLGLTRTVWQSQETDQDCIERLARRNGFVFYLEPSQLGVTKAYYGPDNRAGSPQPALTANMGEASNVVSVRFRNDATKPLRTHGLIAVPGSLTPVALPDVPVLRLPPLALRPTAGRRTVGLSDTANKDLGQAIGQAKQAKLGSLDPVTAEVEIDTVRYGHVLRPRRLVGMRGVGRSYDGPYYVSHLTHKIERGKYTQSATLSREGVGALLPVVRP